MSRMWSIGEATGLIGKAHAVWKPIAVIVAVQLAVLGWMVLDRVRLLSHGREIVLDVVPVDPRSLFRGDYVILSYDISRIDASLMEQPPKPSEPLKAPFYVTIAQTAGGARGGEANPGATTGDAAVSQEPRWTAIKASHVKPAVTAGQVVLKARPDGRVMANNRSAIAARYGIESYFVPEGEGLELEKLVGDKKIKAVVVVGQDGTAALKGLMADGKLVYREPLF